MIIKRRDSRGDIRYGVRVSINGKRQWLGTFAKLGDAKEAERKAHDQKPQAGPTCGDFARRWLAQDCPRLSGRQLKSDTLREYRYHLDRFVKDWDEVPLTGVARDKAFDWALTHRPTVQFVAALFSHAHDLGLVESNPFGKLNLQGSSGRRDKVPLTEAQFSALLSACDVLKAYGPTFRAFLTFQAYTGLRPGETFELRWSDIEGDRIHVSRRLSQRGSVDIPKSGVGRTVLLPPPARAALQEFPRGLDLVFRGSRGQQLNSSTCHTYFKQVRTEAGLPDVDLYDLRHLCAHTLYVKMGLPARVVATQLGHRDGGALVERLYGHGSVGALEELEEAWANVG